MHPDKRPSDFGVGLPPTTAGLAVPQRERILLAILSATSRTDSENY
jgi:hypothetical protein